MMEGSIPSSNFSTPAPGSSTEPATPKTRDMFKPHKAQDWDRVRHKIEQLYRVDQLKLKDVKRILEDQDKFTASEKQYKDKLASWGLRKNVKARELSIIVRKEQKRAARGKKTVFRVAGQEVDEKRIARYKRKRAHNSDNDNSRSIERAQTLESSRDQVSPEPTTPSDMSYWTPEPDTKATTLSPHTDNQPRPFDSSDSIPDSEIDDKKPQPLAFSPINMNDDTLRKNFEYARSYSVNDKGAYDFFNGRMQELTDRMGVQGAKLYSVEEPNQPNPDY
ncbi:Clr5 domain-containing protein [Aspergillus undulatus]|uniref:Clr5 domain-containing protein n=1 Tax=Aspergillus undulatus TaxID=1810928 RepID=UPI003CCD29B4